MTAHLLDVNVLVAMVDPSHVHHDRAHTWFAAVSDRPWLSCPMTQNAVIRIVSHPRYSNSQPVALVMDSLESLLETRGHQFVTDSITLFEPPIQRARLQASGQLTDTYLLALAVTNGAHLATFDVRLVTSGVLGGDEAVALLR